MKANWPTGGHVREKESVSLEWRQKTNGLHVAYVLHTHGTGTQRAFSGYRTVYRTVRKIPGSSVALYAGTGDWLVSTRSFDMGKLCETLDAAKTHVEALFALEYSDATNT